MRVTYAAACQTCPWTNEGDDSHSKAASHTTATGHSTITRGVPA